MNPLLFATLFDGSLWTIITHPFAVIALAYGVPLAGLIAVKLLLPAFDLQFLLTPLSWVLSAEPSTAAQIQSAVKSEVSAATAALTAQLDRIEAQLQPKDVAQPAKS